MATHSNILAWRIPWIEKPVGSTGSQRVGQDWVTNTFTFFVTQHTSCTVYMSCCSVVQSWLTIWDPMDCSMPGLPVLHYLPEFAQTHVHWVNDAIQPSHLLSPPSPALNLSQHQGLFQLICSSYQGAKVLELQLQHQCFQELPGSISFRMDWLDLLAVQGTLKSLLQHHSSKASILQHSAS